MFYRLKWIGQFESKRIQTYNKAMTQRNIYDINKNNVSWVNVKLFYLIFMTRKRNKLNDPHIDRTNFFSTNNASNVLASQRVVMIMIMMQV